MGSQFEGVAALPPVFCCPYWGPTPVEKGRFSIPEKRQLSWAHPVVSDGRLYVRNQDELLVYDIKAK
jgi:hypothetical protein